MILVIVYLAVLLFKRRKYKSFEIKIIVCMLLANLEGISFRLDLVLNDGKAFKSISNVSESILETGALTLITFAHWTYASMYMQTIIILPSLLKKAFLLMTQYDEKLKYENDGMSPISKSYRVRHDKIDFSIK